MNTRRDASSARKKEERADKRHAGPATHPQPRSRVLVPALALLVPGLAHPAQSCMAALHSVLVEAWEWPARPMEERPKAWVERR